MARHRAVVPISERLWAKVHVGNPDECWTWTGSVGSHGYGQVSNPVTKRPSLVHRLVYEMRYGEIARGMFVCHRCDNRKCVNPHHLFVGSALDNVRDCVSKGRWPVRAGLRGSSNPSAKLTEELVIAMRQAVSHSGATRTALAKRFGISRSTLHDAIVGRTWTHVVDRGVL